MHSPEQPRLDNGTYSHKQHGAPSVGLTNQQLDGAFESLMTEYPELGEVAEACDQTGASVYLVGGAMRDLSLDQVPKDLDLCSSLKPDEFRQAMSDVDCSLYDVGEEHGTTGANFVRADGESITIEHTTHRQETYTSPDSRQPTVQVGASLHEDLLRRDFTVNAMAMNLTDGSIEDPFDGLTDIQNGILRTPNEPNQTFNEDPLRISRLVRFASTRGWDVAPETFEAAQNNLDRMPIIAHERKLIEIRKVIESSPASVDRAARLMQELGTDANQHLWEGFGDQIEPGEIDETLAADTDDLMAAVALRSSDPLNSMRRLRFTNDEVALCKRTLSAVGALPGLDYDPEAARAVVRQYRPDDLACAARIGAGRDFDLEDTERFLGTIDEHRSFADQPLPLDGHDFVAMGLKGPEIGKALHRIEAAMITNPALTKDQARNMFA